MAQPVNYNDQMARQLTELSKRVDNINVSVEETNRKIRTAATIGGAAGGAVVGGVIGAFCPPAGWVVWKAATVGAIGGGVAGAGVGAIAGHCLTTNPKKN